jgi:hypothetical protein
VSRAGHSTHDRDEKYVRRLAEKKEGTPQRVQPKGIWKEYNKIGNKGIRHRRLWRGFIRLNTRPCDRLF